MPLNCWYMDDSDADQRLPHQQTPNAPASVAAIRALGVVSWRLDADDTENDPKLEAIRAVRGYNYQDVITVSPDRLPGYEAKIKTFFEEHLHDDEEIRYVLDGSGAPLCPTKGFDQNHATRVRPGLYNEEIGSETCHCRSLTVSQAHTGCAQPCLAVGPSVGHSTSRTQPWAVCRARPCDLVTALHAPNPGRCAGYFDVRDKDDRWIRIECRKGDMIVLPEGMYHRFTLDENNYIQVRDRPALRAPLHTR